jgi:hypothetical protein
VIKMLRVTCAFVLFLFLVNTATAQDQPTLAKDSLQITAFTVNVYKGCSFALMVPSRVAANSTCSIHCRPDHG